MVKKIYIIEKYVKADSIVEAMKLERSVRPSQVYLSEESRKHEMEQIEKDGNNKLHKLKKR